MFRINDKTNMVNSLIFSLFMLLLTKALTSTKTTCRCRCYVYILVEIIITRLIAKYMSSLYLKMSVRLNRTLALCFFLVYLFYSHFTHSDRVNILNERITELEYEHKFLIDRLYGSLRRSFSNSIIQTKPVERSNPAHSISEDED